MEVPAAGGHGDVGVVLLGSGLQARRTIHDAHVPGISLLRVQQRLRTSVGQGCQVALSCRKTTNGSRVDRPLPVLDCRDCHHLRKHRKGTWNEL